MRKENRLMTFTAIVVLVAMLSLCLVSGTYAKYTSEFTGSDTVVVARWDVSTSADSATVDLFDKSVIYDTANGYGDQKASETDVKQEGEDAVIAPGTWGSFAYEVSNSSQVKATYTTTFNVEGAGVPLEFTTDPEGTWNSDIADVTATTLDFEETDTVTIYWRWAYEGDDAADTLLGEADTLAKPTVTITTTFVQAD